jgi:hypothetical protein
MVDALIVSFRLSEKSAFCHIRDTSPASGEVNDALLNEVFLMS